jgi:hypothetical protein
VTVIYFFQFLAVNIVQVGLRETDLPPPPPKKKLVHSLCDKIAEQTQFGRQENKARKRHSAEQIINKLREAEVHLAEGMRVELVAKELRVTNWLRKNSQ